jgi:hypothetical protein
MIPKLMVELPQALGGLQKTLLGLLNHANTNTSTTPNSSTTPAK